MAHNSPIEIEDIKSLNLKLKGYPQLSLGLVTNQKTSIKALISSIIHVFTRFLLFSSC